jgi:hypothetical protein
MTGKCPKCDKAVSSVTLAHVRVSAGIAARAAFHGVSYLCPFCHVILGVGTDPAASKARGTPEALTGGRRKQGHGGPTH